MDYLETLFPNTTQADVDASNANLAAMRAEEAARVAAVKAELAGGPRLAPRCMRCAGSGKLAQFTHRAGGVCFACGGSGLA